MQDSPAEGAEDRSARIVSAPANRTTCSACGSPRFYLEPPVPGGYRYGYCEDCGEESTTEPAVPAYSLADFLDLKIPPRRFLLDPVLRERDLFMIHGWRGLGKSYLAQALSLAVANGGGLLGWRAPEPVGVCLVDGELSGHDLQERLAALVQGSGYRPQAPLRIVPADLAELGIPPLDTEEGQAAVEEHLDGCELLVLDNQSSLFRSSHEENSAESWAAPQAWLLSLRRRGVAVGIVHHSGKKGEQRGTSRREDVLNLVLGLHKPPDWRPDEGARFELRFEKTRGIMGAAARTIDCHLETADRGGLVFAGRAAEPSTRERVRQLLPSGLSDAKIAEQLGVHRSTVGRHRKAIEDYAT